jgi:crotonobetainyl-CoA:carnitine CoA-transferase CaiB-like acyl-CoA transferase
MPGPLDGIRVLDLTAALAGPYCTMVLADLGAEVIKIESPAGEVTRRVGPDPEPDGSGEPTLGGYFQSINRGKRSIAIDLKTDAGRHELLALVRTADVFVENFGPGVVDRLGLSYAEIRAVNPRIVYASLTGFGAAWAGASPYAEWPAMDITIQAMAGALSITGTEDGQPIKIGPGIGDIFPGVMLSSGILAALLEAKESGLGQQVDVAMYDAILALCERIVYQYSYTGQVPRPVGNTHPILTPFDVLEAKDGWIAIAATTQGRWKVLCSIMGQPELVDDPRFLHEGLRAKNRALVRQIVAVWVAEHTRDEVTSMLAGRVPVGPVNDVHDIFEDPHGWVRDMLVRVDNPGSDTRAVIAGQPIKLSRTPSAVRGRAPFLDEDGAAIRSELKVAASPVEVTS